MNFWLWRSCEGLWFAHAILWASILDGDLPLAPAWRVILVAVSLIVVALGNHQAGMEERERIIRAVWGGDTAEVCWRAWQAGREGRSPFPSEPPVTLQ